MPLPSTSNISIFLGIILRAIQVIFSVMVLSLSIHLIASHKNERGPLPELICVAALAGLISLITSLMFAASTLRPFLRSWVVPVGDSIAFLLHFLVGILFAKRLKGASCHSLHEDLKAHVDTICEDFDAGAYPTYFACLNAYFRTVRALERYCVIVTTDTVFLFATAMVLSIIGLLTYTRIGKVCRERVMGR